MGFGAVLGIGVDDDVSGREGLEHPLFGLDHHLVRLLQAELRIQVRVHLDVHVGPRGARPQLVHAADLGVGGHAADDLGSGAIGQLVVEQLPGGVAEYRDRPPDQPAGHHQACRGVHARRVEQGGHADADQGDDVGGDVHQVVGPIPRDGDRLGLGQDPALGAGQGQGQQQRNPHHRHGPALGLDRLGRDQVAHGLLADQGRGGEHQARLQQAGEGFTLAVAVAVLAVGRSGGVAHRDEGPERGDDIERRIRQGGQGRHRPRGQPGQELDQGQHQRRRHRQAGDPPGQGGGLGDRQAAEMSFVVVV